MKKLFLTICLLFLLCSVSWAAGGCQTGWKTGSTCNVTTDGSTASCEGADVSAAFAQVSDGDTILLKENGDCSWGQPEFYGNKNPIFNGNGSVIRGPGFYISGPKTFRITNFNFRMNSAGQASIRVFGSDSAGVTTTGWRIDHNTFEEENGGATVFQHPIYVQGQGGVHPYGLIDHNTFKNAAVAVVGYNACDDDIHNITDSLDLGGPTAVYIEDNTFWGTMSSAMNSGDSACRGQTVYRFNTITDSYLEQHSVQGNSLWGARKWEVYNNLWQQVYLTSFVAVGRNALIRGGTGVFFNNSFTGTWLLDMLFFDNVHSFDSRLGDFCNGTFAADQNETVVSGTHTGGNGEAILADSSKTWTTNIWMTDVLIGEGNTITGTHTPASPGGNSTTTLTDSAASFTTGYAATAIGYWLHNTTKNEGCKVTSVTANTLTCSAGLSNSASWEHDDVWALTGGAYIFNTTSNASGQIRANGTNTITVTLLGGTRQTWSTGDTYEIRSGWPCTGQIGVGSFTAGKQDKVPAYLWNNVKGASVIPVYVRDGITQKLHILPDRDFYDYSTATGSPQTTGTRVGLYANMPAACTAGVGYWATDKGGNWNTLNADANDGMLYKCTTQGNAWAPHYTPYTYPHPLNTDVADEIAPTVTNITIGADGLSWIFTYSEPVTAVATADLCDATSYTAAMTTAGAITLAYASGAGTNTIVCTGTQTVYASDTVANGGVDYGGTAIKDLAGTPNLMVAKDNIDVTNNSQEQAPSGTKTLTVTLAGETGTVSSQGNLINCGATCEYAFDNQSAVTLTAVPDTNNWFFGWSGTGGCTGTSTCQLTMSAAKAATATFYKKPQSAGGTFGGGSFR